jgi:hypothetical protein
MQPAPADRRIDTPNADATPCRHPPRSADSYLTLHYRLADLDGSEYVSTFDLSPATLQMGSGQLAETLESCLIGLPPANAMSSSSPRTRPLAPQPAPRRTHRPQRPAAGNRTARSTR